MNILPSPDQIKQPDRPKLADIMGPGLITGASDDDPSGIATYSQAGAQFGYSLAWTLLNLRKRFKDRFTVDRMAKDYLMLYRRLADDARSSSRSPAFAESRDGDLSRGLSGP